MSLAATLTSVGIGKCSCHFDSHGNPITIDVTAVSISGSSDIFINGLPAARLGDLMQGSCGHFGTIISGAVDTFQNGLPAARLGDITQGCVLVSIISGSTDTMIA